MTAPLKHFEPITVGVALGERAYDIVIGRDVLQSLGARVAALRPGSRVAIITDRNVAKHWLEKTASGQLAHIIVAEGGSLKTYISRQRSVQSAKRSAAGSFGGRDRWRDLQVPTFGRLVDGSAITRRKANSLAIEIVLICRQPDAAVTALRRNRQIWALRRLALRPKMIFRILRNMPRDIMPRGRGARRARDGRCIAQSSSGGAATGFSTGSMRRRFLSAAPAALFCAAGMTPT